MKLTLAPLPQLEFWGRSMAVNDESEIGHAVAELCGDLSRAEQDIVLLYDGTSDDHIVVSVGPVQNSESQGRVRITSEEVTEGASITFHNSPDRVADMWVLIDAELEKRNLTSFGIHRQILGKDGRVTLQAPVRARD